MLQSMTGYGKSQLAISGKTILVEVKSLNSRGLDLKLRLPGDLKEREMELRKLISEHVVRGKVDLNLDIQGEDGAQVNLNESLFKGYYKALSRICTDLSIPQGEILQTIMRIQGVVAPPVADLTEDEWVQVKTTVQKALEDMRRFRRKEGEVLAAELRRSVTTISDALTQIEEMDVHRMVRVRERMQNNLVEALGVTQLDTNRFEQEVLYYLEKLNIKEEKVRLEQHCKFFQESMIHKEDENAGRTLNFISQEMGREINTLGSKAQDHDMQRIVVIMKEELDNIKEQLANVL
jgi:uncharacterized protein (TIGR00255 family)